MKKVVDSLLIGVCALAAICSSCGDPPQRTKADTLSASVSKTVTVANHSYIETDIRMDYGDFVPPTIILEVIRDFEKAHPELEVTGSSLVSQSSADIFYVRGILLDHRPREK